MKERSWFQSTSLSDIAKTPHPLSSILHRLNTHSTATWLACPTLLSLLHSRYPFRSKPKSAQCHIRQYSRSMIYASGCWACCGCDCAMFRTSMYMLRFLMAQLSSMLHCCMRNPMFCRFWCWCSGMWSLTSCSLDRRASRSSTCTESTVMKLSRSGMWDWVMVMVMAADIFAENLRLGFLTLVLA